MFATIFIRIDSYVLGGYYFGGKTQYLVARWATRLRNICSSNWIISIGFWRKPKLPKCTPYFIQYRKRFNLIETTSVFFFASFHTALGHCAMKGTKHQHILEVLYNGEITQVANQIHIVVTWMQKCALVEYLWYFCSSVFNFFYTYIWKNLSIFTGIRARFWIPSEITMWNPFQWQLFNVLQHQPVAHLLEAIFVRNSGRSSLIYVPSKFIL